MAPYGRLVLPTVCGNGLSNNALVAMAAQFDKCPNSLQRGPGIRIEYEYMYIYIYIYTNLFCMYAGMNYMFVY